MKISKNKNSKNNNALENYIEIIKINYKVRDIKHQLSKNNEV
jgi:hypothetical protein